MSALPVAAAQHGLRLEQACLALGLPLPAASRDALLAYLAQLQRWNRTYNLTAIRDPEQMLVQHLFDSLAVVPTLQRIADQHPGTAVRVLDVGSGAGLPGLVLAVMHPSWQVVCVDAVEKKTAFIKQMAGVLGLPNLQAQHARVETLAPLECTMVVSRAFASLADFVSLAGMHAGRNGTLAAMKGRLPEQEIAALHEHGDWQVKNVEPLVVPALDAQRCVVLMQRKQGIP